MLNKDFKRLFSKREIEEIRGRRNKNTIILTLILFGTFLAIALATGGLEYLSLKMNDPFVQNLEIEIPFSKSKLVEYYKTDLNKDSLRLKFNYDTVVAHVDYPLLFLNQKRNERRRVKGRSMEVGNPLLSQITGKDNLIVGRPFIDEYDCGFIVTEKLLIEFGYDKNALFIKMAVAKENEGYYIVPVPIIAIVKELPGLSSFIFTPYFFKVRTNSYENPYNIKKHKDLSIYIPFESQEKAKEIRKTINAIVSKNHVFTNRDPLVDMYKNNDTYAEGRVINITFDPAPVSVEKTWTFYDVIVNAPELEKYKMNLNLYYLYKFPMTSQSRVSFDKISVIFNSLSKVREFKKSLFDKFELDVEMSKVKDKENFIAISIITITLATLLFVFSIISVGLFIFNLLKSHLDKIKMNLGTFKAFGMSNNLLQLVYKAIIRKFYLQALLIAYCCALVLDLFAVLIFFPELSVTQLLNFYVIMAVLVIWFLVEWVFTRTSKVILENTPGDLIYGRD